MKRAFSHISRLPHQLSWLGGATKSAAPAAECPTCGAARSVDCFANAASSGGTGAGSSTQAARATSTAQQQRCNSDPAHQAERHAAVSAAATAPAGSKAATHALGTPLQPIASGFRGRGSNNRLLQTLAFAGGTLVVGGGASYVTGILPVDRAGMETGSLPAIPIPFSFGAPSTLGRSAAAPYFNFMADAAAKAAPAVVNITLRDPSRPLDDAPNGSGFIIAADGTIVTNTHIIAEAIPAAMPAADSSSQEGRRVILCTLQDGRSFEAQLVNFDWLSDLAVLQIKAQSALPVAKLGRSTGLRVGEWVLAVGSPLHLSNSVSAGIISALARKGEELGMGSAPTDFIQTDAAINVGSSGGPLVNVQGEVVGITSMKAVGDGVSFAIPIDTARDVVDQLLACGRVVRPYIGIRMVQLTASMAAELKARSPTFPSLPTGIYVPYVHPGSPADRAGLLPGDTITGFPGQIISSTGLTQALSQHIGKPLPLDVVRSDGSCTRLSVTATEAMQLAAP